VGAEGVAARGQCGCIGDKKKGRYFSISLKSYSAQEILEIAKKQQPSILEGGVASL
jgi:hypothetical protein